MADKRGQVVGGRGAKTTDDYMQCISAVCVFTRITFSQMAYHVSVSVSSCDLVFPPLSTGAGSRPKSDANSDQWGEFAREMYTGSEVIGGLPSEPAGWKRRAIRGVGAGG